MKAKDILNHEVTEAELEKKLEKAFRTGGWRFVHFKAAKVGKNNKYLTHFSGDSGYVDYTAVHPGRGVLFVELKTMKGKASKPQKAWALDFEACKAPYYLIKPDNIDEFIEKIIWSKV